MYKSYLKRYLDFTTALIALAFLSPLLLLVSLSIKIDSRGPILYSQKRLGLHGRTFNLYKFRSMTDVSRSASKQTYIGDPEITTFGSFIRRFKIDELPQLLNVLKGDMSIVGPRPCLPELKSEFDDNGLFRTQVRPGLTGLAQVNGNIFLSWPQRWKLDRIYVENLRFSLDCKIILKTISVVFLGEKCFINSELL